MKCLVFSDSHGDSFLMNEALIHNRDCDAVFFLGDGIRGAESLSEFDNMRSWFFVLGNCDFKTEALGNAVPKTDEIIIEGKKIVFTHGDLYGVKSDMRGLIALAKEREADAVLFGHTHKAGADFLSVDGRGVWFLNPGSASSYKSGSFGVLNVTETDISFSICTL